MHRTIIGGGIQGTTIAIKLREVGMSIQNLTIIDPHDSLCEQFHKCTNRIAMPYLRSPIVHHIHPDPFHLKKFAKMNQYINPTFGRYQRSQTEMFMDHTHAQIHNYHLNQSYIQSYVQRIEKNQRGWSITTSHHSVIQTDCVVLAQGCHNEPFVPAAFTQAKDVCHIFSDHFNSQLFSQSSHVIGSGISAAHLTLKVLKLDKNKIVHLWMNKNIDIQHFDADPGWLGPKKMKAFLNHSSHEEKLQTVLTERHKGSMPHELYLRLKKYVQNKRLIIHKEEIKDLKSHQIITENLNIPYDYILLATGFKPSILQQPMIQSLIQNANAPLLSCGFPKITHELEWLPHLFVAGGLADLELGPFARNIMGGKEAAQRIYSVFQRINHHREVS